MSFFLSVNMPTLELGTVLYFTLSCGCFLQFTNAIPCSPCSDDSDCLPFLEHCQIPEELQNIPDFLISSKSLSEDASKGRFDYFISINRWNEVYATPYVCCIFILFRPVPYPKDFYNDVQGKDKKTSTHSRDIGNFSIIQFQYFINAAIMYIYVYWSLLYHFYCRITTGIFRCQRITKKESSNLGERKGSEYNNN